MSAKIYKVNEEGNRSKSYKVIYKVTKVKQVNSFIFIETEYNESYTFSLEKHSIEVFADLQ